VFDVLGSNALENGDFKSVFDTFLEAATQDQLEQDSVLAEDLFNEVLETLSAEQKSLLMSFLVQVQIAFQEPYLKLDGLFQKQGVEPDLESDVPGSPGFALRSLELAIGYSVSQVENKNWTLEEAKTQLSAYVKHWLKHEPCLDCKEPKFFASHELVPAAEYLQRIESEKKVLPQKQKQMDQFLLATKKSNFKIPFFTTFKVEETKPKQMTLLQSDIQVKTKLAAAEFLVKNELDLELKVGELEKSNSPEVKLEGADQIMVQAEEEFVDKVIKKNDVVKTEVLQQTVVLPQVKTRIDRALDWFAEQLQDIGKPESMEDDDWSKILAWMQSKRSKSVGETLEHLERLGQLRRMDVNQKGLLDPLQKLQADTESSEQEGLESEPQKSRATRFQRALADVYQVVKMEASFDKTEQTLKNYTLPKIDVELPSLQKLEHHSLQDANSQVLAQSKSGEQKMEHTSAAPKFTPVPQSSGWDSELLNKFIESTRESLKIWVDKKYVAMRIQIEPVELGKITLKTIVEQGKIGVLIQAESQMTKDLLQFHLHEMKEILKQQGLEVAGFQVDVKEQQKGFSDRKSSSSSKFELETLLQDDNSGAEAVLAQAKGLIDQVA